MLPLLAALLCWAGSACDDDGQPTELAFLRASDVYELRTTLQPYPWSGRVAGYAPDAEPGGTWALDYEVDIDLTHHLPEHPEFSELIVAVQGEPRYAADGTWQAGFGSVVVTSVFTGTGMPVERFAGWPRLTALHGKDGSPFEAVHRTPLHADFRKPHHLSGRLEVQLPPDTPVGWYEPRVMVFARPAGAKAPVLVDNFGDNANTQDAQILPLVRVGDAAERRLPLSLSTHVPYRGLAGVLAEEDRGRVALIARSGFPRAFVVPPSVRELDLGFPTLFPERIVAPVEGGLDVIPQAIRSYLDPSSLSVSFEPLQGCGYTRAERRAMLVDPENRPFDVDLSGGGECRVRLDAQLRDSLGRPLSGGGTYSIIAARPLSFSTSVKPGTPFFVGESYPAKVNVTPPVPAEVSVEVRWLPDGDPDRERRWTATGRANRFGHFVPYDAEPLVFDEPAEYVSYVRATWTDPQGMLWMGDQTSAGVVAPTEGSAITLHGTRSSPHNLRPDEPWNGAQERFAGRIDAAASFLPFKPGAIPDTFPPARVEDTLFVQANGFLESIIEPQLSVAVHEPELAARLQEGLAVPTVVPPPTLQLSPGPWRVLQDVVEISVDSAAWFPADAAHRDEIPVAPVGDGRWHPFAFPQGNRVDAHLYLGVVRPGFPVLTSVYQSDAIGLYWMASPNRFGYHFGAGTTNGDLPGDFYRIQGSAFIADRESGRAHFGAYGAAIAVADADGESTGIQAPGERPLVRTMGREHRLFVGQDTHDILEQGELLALGGMVAPAVDSEVRWTVTSPSGQETLVTARSNPIGIVRGKPLIAAEEVGLYRVRADVRAGELRGDVLGSADGRFWHAVVPKDDPGLLTVDLGPVTPVDPVEGVEIPLRWPEDIDDATVHFGVISPGRILDQGSMAQDDGGWEYRFAPLQVAVQHTSYDARNYADGSLQLVDTVVFTFVLTGTRGGQPIIDARRLAIRGDRLLTLGAGRNEGAGGATRRPARGGAGLPSGIQPGRPPGAAPSRPGDGTRRPGPG